MGDINVKIIIYIKLFNDTEVAPEICLGELK